MNTTQLGRPKDEELTEKVLNTAYELFSNQAYNDISLVKIAEVAGVSRKALYSRWQNKAILVIEAFQFVNPPAKPLAAETVHQSLLNFLEHSMQVTNQHLVLFSDLLAEIYQQPETLAFFETSYSKPRQQIYQQLLTKGIELGEFSPDLDISLVAECLSAIIRQRIMLRKPITLDFIQKVVALLIH